MIEIQTVAEVLALLDRNTTPSGGQRALSPTDLDERAADWVTILDASGVTDAQLREAAARCIIASRWRPEIADILTAVNGSPSTPRQAEAVAVADLAVLESWAGFVAGLGGVLPEWSAVRAAVADSSRRTKARDLFADPPQVDRIASAVMRLGGWAAVVRARTDPREGSADPWRDYGFSWRAVYAGSLEGGMERAAAALGRVARAELDQREAPPAGLRLIGGRDLDDAAVRRADARDMAHVGAVIDGLRRPT